MVVVHTSLLNGFASFGRLKVSPPRGILIVVVVVSLVCLEVRKEGRREDGKSGAEIEWMGITLGPAPSKLGKTRPVTHTQIPRNVDFNGTSTSACLNKWQPCGLFETIVTIIKSLFALSFCIIYLQCQLFLNLSRVLLEVILVQLLLPIPILLQLLPHTFRHLRSILHLDR